MNNLMVKTVAGFLFLMFILGLCIFLPAGTLSYWQGWVFLAVFAGCVILITAYLIRFDQRLLASRVQAGPTAETQKSQQLLQSLASLFFLALFIIPGLDYRFHWSQVPPWLSLLSDALVALGFYIVFLVFRANTYTSATIEVTKEQKVIETGPYGVVRHPMYAGASILLIFAPLALGSWVGVPFALPILLVVALRAVEEEKFLATNLSGYADYRQKVRYRIIPGVW